MANGRIEFLTDLLNSGRVLLILF